MLTTFVQDHEYRVIQHGLEAEKRFNETVKESSFLEIFQRAHWRRTFAGCLGICSQWAAGAPIVFGYSTVVFTSLVTGAAEADPVHSISSKLRALKTRLLLPLLREYGLNAYLPEQSR